MMPVTRAFFLDLDLLASKLEYLPHSESRRGRYPKQQIGVLEARPRRGCRIPLDLRGRRGGCGRGALVTEAGGQLGCQGRDGVFGIRPFGHQHDLFAR
jgi:hypothetical protein